jgi:hypothetical protein
MGRAAAQEEIRSTQESAPASVGLSVAETCAASERRSTVWPVSSNPMAEPCWAGSDPFGGTPLLLVALPGQGGTDSYQRDPSDAHVKRLMGVIETIGGFSIRLWRSVTTAVTSRPMGTTGCRR